MLGLVVLAMVAVLVVWGRQWTDNRQSAPSPTWKPAPTSTVAGTPRFDVARAQLAALPAKGWDSRLDFERSRFGQAWSDDVNVNSAQQVHPA